MGIKCIDPWLVDKGTCPQCKADILKSLGLGEAVQQPSSADAVAETTLTDEENSLETIPNVPSATDAPESTDSVADTADQTAVEAAGIEIEGTGTSGVANGAFEGGESVELETETNSIAVKSKIV